MSHSKSIMFSIVGLLATAAFFTWPASSLGQTPVGDSLSTAQAVTGQFISWQEHIIDDAESAGFNLNGSDGLVLGDIDGDGFEDIVSVHEYDSGYDSASHVPGFVAPADGHVRIAFGTSDPDVWFNITVAEGSDAPAPEDAALADLNGDGFLDIMVATELSHLIYLQNPGRNARTETWSKLILPMTKNKGSYIRVFLADLDGDGKVEVTAANKGAQTPGPEDYARSTPVSIFKFVGDPLQGSSWTEFEIGHFSIPQNAEPVDLDADGDFDIIVGTRGEGRLVLFENIDGEPQNFEEQAIGIVNQRLSGFNLEYADLNNDGRLDIIGASNLGLSWIEQPAQLNHAWNAHTIGSFAPDSFTGIETADIDGDGDIDVISGSYSRGLRTADGDAQVTDALGRIGWFENPGDASGQWARHDVSRRIRGMYDKFIARDVDGDGDVDFLATRGNSFPYDGVFWLEQTRSDTPQPAFQRAREVDSPEMPLP